MPLWSVNRHRQSLSRSNDSLRFRHRPYAFDTSSVVPLRSSSCQAPDLVLPRPFPSVLTTMAFEPQPPKVVWNLLLPAGSEGPSLIDQAVTHIGPSSALCARGALASAKLKMAALAPMLSASKRTATATKPGCRRSVRNAYRASQTAPSSRVQPHVSQAFSAASVRLPSSRRSAICATSPTLPASRAPPAAG